jgi:hypothetical protein
VRRFIAPLLAAALLQTGCLGHMLAGVGSDTWGADQYSVAPAETDAKLSCGEVACASAPVEQTWKRGRSRGVFWATFIAELGLGTYGMFSTVDSSGGLDAAGLLFFDLGFTLATLDVISYARADDYGVQRDPARLAKPVVADWRGMKVPLRVSDVMPFGVEAPKTFSVAAAAKRVTTPAPVQTASAVAPAPPPPGAKLSKGKVAVLDLKSSTKELSPDDVRYFGDLVRAATLKAAPQLEVMTRENLLVLLQSAGRDPASCEGECEVDTGRRIGADAIVSGEVLKIGTRYKLALRLHETRDGKLLGAAVASGRSIDELDDAVGRAATELFGSAP